MDNNIFDLSFESMMKRRTEKDNKKIDEKIPQVLELIKLELFTYIDSTKPDATITFEVDYEFLQSPVSGGLCLSFTQVEELHKRMTAILEKLGWKFETGILLSFDNGNKYDTGYKCYDYKFTPLVKTHDIT